MIDLLICWWKKNIIWINNDNLLKKTCQNLIFGNEFQQFQRSIFFTEIGTFRTLDVSYRDVSYPVFKLCNYCMLQCLCVIFVNRNMFIPNCRSFRTIGWVVSYHRVGRFVPRDVSYPESFRILLKLYEKASRFISGSFRTLCSFVRQFVDLLIDNWFVDVLIDWITDLLT